MLTGSRRIHPVNQSGFFYHKVKSYIFSKKKTTFNQFTLLLDMFFFTIPFQKNSVLRFLPSYINQTGNFELIEIAI